jgi:hypothetical protein
MEHTSFCPLLMAFIWWDKTQDTIKKNKEAVLDARKENGLEVNPEKTKYMLRPRYQKAGEKQSIKIGNRSLEEEAKSKYYGVTLRTTTTKTTSGTTALPGASRR